MTDDALTALAFAAAWTPGPDNAALAASGARFGLRRSPRHAFGVAFRESRLLRETLRRAGGRLAALRANACGQKAGAT